MRSLEGENEGGVEDDIEMTEHLVKWLNLLQSSIHISNSAKIELVTLTNDTIPPKKT